MGPQGRTIEEKLARIASSEWGVVTTRELLLAGFSAKQIRGRRERGLLIPQYKGVYRVGHTAPSTEATYLAAVKACGEGALLSGRAAAYIQGLIKGRPPPPEVTCPTERKIAGIQTKRCRNMDPRDAANHRGIPITCVPKTLVDLAGSEELDDDDLARACHEAGIRYGTNPSHVQAVLDRHPKAKGAKKLKAVLTGEQRVTLSTLEREFLRLLKVEGLPLPITNRPAGTKRVDCRWPDHKLTVELDSYRFHNSRYAWEQDRLREREACARLDEFSRYTWADVFEEPGAMLGELRVLLRG